MLLRNKFYKEKGFTWDDEKGLPRPEYVYWLERKVEEKPLEDLKEIEDIFDDEITSHAAETILGLESWIDGKDSFFRRLKNILIKK